jgi:hypothetical protein
MAFPPLAIYFPDNQLKTREEIQRELLERLTGGGTGGGGGGGGNIIPPGGGGDSSTDSAEPDTPDTPSDTTTTGGGGTTGSGGSGTGVSTPGDYNTSDDVSTTGGGDTPGGVSTPGDGPTTEGPTTGGGGTTQTNGEVDPGYTTGYSGTIILITPDDDPDPPPDTGGSGTSLTSYLPDPCDDCLPGIGPFTLGCGTGYEFNAYGGGGMVSVPWVWSDCFELEVVYGDGSDDGMGGCNWNPRVCPLFVIDPFGDFISTLCSCALHYGCENEYGNCFDPNGPPGEICAVEYACCYHKQYTDLSYQCLTSVVTGSAAAMPSAYVCRICPR